MEEKQDPKADETKAQIQKMANRQTSITVGAVIFGMGIGQSVSEGMTAQPVGLRILAVAVAAGLAAGIFGFLLSKVWRA